MRLREIADRLELKFVAGENLSDREISDGFVSDMLSNVVAEAEDNVLWITIQTHINILAVSLLKDVGAIVITQGEVPHERLVEAADSNEMPILTTELSTFEFSGKLYELLKS